MTGLERLRDMAEFYEGIGSMVQYSGEPMCDVLHRIAADIEREQDALVKDSPYDALPPDERESIAWVREHGGLESVESRLMPEGMEWPRDAKGVPIVRGETVFANGGGKGDGRAWYVRRVSPGSGYPVEAVDGKGEKRDLKARWLTHERPAPKVLDADGVEIRVGDEVYLLLGDWCDEFPCFGYHGGEELEVFSLHADHVVGGIGCRDTHRPKGTCYPQPSQLTHRAPVLAADGKPLREGQTVWHKSGFACGVVETIDSGSLMHTTRYRDESGTVYRDAAKDLVHKRPDSWERIEADVMVDAKDYCESRGISPEYPKHIGKAKCEDLVRRAKKLAGRDGS